MITTQTRDDIRLDAWSRVFEKTNRILSEQKVTVRIRDDIPFGMEEVAGWTDGLDINLNAPMVRRMVTGNDPVAAVLRLKGLNYHELCHVLFTPRMTDDLVRTIMEKQKRTGDKKWWYSFNALEDQRIETWFTATYGASRRYFEAMILEWLIKDGTAESAILLYGRKYLTPAIRVQAGRVFTKKYGRDLYEEFKSVIDEYITLVLPTDGIRAKACIERFKELLDEMMSKAQAGLPQMPVNDNGMHDGNPQRGDEGCARVGRVLVKNAREARDRAEAMVDDAIDADQEEQERRENGDHGQGSEDQASEVQDAGDKGLDANAEGEGEGQAGQDSSGSGQGESATPNGSGVGKGAGSEDAEISLDASVDEWRELMNEAYDAMDDVRADEQVQNDIDNVLDAVRANENNGRMAAQGKEARTNSVPASEGARLAVRRISNILTRIRQEAEPETLKRQVHGRVDVRRALTRQAHEVDIFKQWDSGSEEETGIEAVVLVDTSISMAQVMSETAESMWALKRAFDKLDIRTTVMLYNYHHEILFQPSDKAHPAEVPAIRADGGTNPMSGLDQALRILSKSQEPNKVLITVTDGQWQCNDTEVRKLMKPMQRAGVVSMLLGLENAVAQNGAHHHTEAHDMTTIRDLPKAALKLVGGIMRSKV